MHASRAAEAGGIGGDLSVNVFKRVLCGLLILLLAAASIPSARQERSASALLLSGPDEADPDSALPVLEAPLEPAILAHRGASGYRRENTLDAFRLAGELDADLIELDVRETSDGQLAVIHNAAVGVRKVADMTLAQLQSVRPGVTTLEDALRCIAGTEMGVMIELKTSGVERQALDCAQTCGMFERALFASFSTDVLNAIQALSPEAHTVYLVREKAVLNSLIRMPEQMDYDVVAAKYTLLSAAKVRTLHQEGRRVIAWTVNNVPDLRLIAAMGVDGIITDYPDRARG